MVKDFVTYKRQILTQDLLSKLSPDNFRRIPRHTKITLHASSKSVLQEEARLFFSLVNIQLISGQYLKRTRAAVSIANFHLREKQILGGLVTLRKDALCRLLTNLQRVSFARDRQFKSSNIANSKQGLYTGLKDLLNFLEMERNYKFFYETKQIDVALDKPSKFFGCDFQSKKVKSIEVRTNHLLLTGLQIPA